MGPATLLVLLLCNINNMITTQQIIDQFIEIERIKGTYSEEYLEALEEATGLIELCEIVSVWVRSTDGYIAKSYHYVLETLDSM